MTLGQRLYEMRRGKGLSQEQAAEILGVTRQTISKWESDQTTPDFDKILPLCELYNISTDELLKGESKQDVPEQYNGNIYNDYYTDNNISQNEPVQNSDSSEEFNRRKVRSSIIMSVAVGFYILSVIPFFTLKDSKMMLTLFFIIIAVATVMVVFAALSRPKPDKSQLQSKEYKLYKQITSILAGAVLVLYMLISFMTGMWHITWLVWVIYGVICEIIKLVFALKGREINEE